MGDRDRRGGIAGRSVTPGDTAECQREANTHRNETELIMSLADSSQPSATTKRNIFVVGLDAFHLSELRTLPHADRYRFHPLFTHDQLRRSGQFPVRELLEEGGEILRSFPERVDAVVGFWDFPVSTVLPLLRANRGLPGPTLESVLRCEHKYWSRVEQARVIPDQIPDFCEVDPFADDPLSQVTLDFPFWIKPVKSVLSHLGFHIESEEDFEHAIERIRRGIRRFGDPFDQILRQADLPPEIEPVRGSHCIVESMISAGRQCTIEGYCYRGEVHVYGTVDSLREGAVGSSFSRYQYPSKLPESVQRRMADLARRVMRQIGYDTAPFNIEFYWEEETDRLWLLEINSRISKSHAPLFKMVDGCHHFQVMIDLGLGQPPEMPHRLGKDNAAAKFMVRLHEDALVTRVPTRGEIDAVQAEVPDTLILIDVETGMRLSELPNQDSYSFEVATIFIGGRDEQELQHKYDEVLRRLPLRFDTQSTSRGHRQTAT